MISTDGRNWEITGEWQEKGGDDANNLMSAVFAKGRFVVAGGGGGGPTAGGHVLVSTDGRAWRETWKAPNRINPIVFGNDRFVVGGPNRQMYWSVDGEKWNAGAKLEEKACTHFRHGAFGNGVFVITGNHGGNSGPFWVAVSPDGEKVTNLSTNLPNIRALAFGSGHFVIVGEGGTRIASTDGKTWNAANGAANENFSWVIWTGKEFLCGSGKTVYASATGAEWKVTGMKPQGAPKWTDGTRFINSSWPGKMSYSRDGQKWEASPAMTPNGINKVVRGEIEGR